MLKAKRFDIGTWAHEKRERKKEIVESNSTIVDLNKLIELQENQIRDLKRKILVLSLFDFLPLEYICMPISCCQVECLDLNSNM